MTIRMIRQEDGKTADVHPAEVDNMVKHGWYSADPLDHDNDGKPGGSMPQGDIPEELEALREQAKSLGIRVHWKQSAETIQAAITAKLAE